MATLARRGMIETGFATLEAVAALRNIFVGLPFALPYTPGSSEPWWVLAYGQLLNIGDYPELWQKYGTFYGGDGTTTFRVPDFRGRTIAGKDDMGGTSANRLTSPLNGDVLGNVGGAQSVALTIAQLPAHDHDITVSQNAAGQAITIFRQAGGSFDAANPYGLGRFGGTAGTDDEAADLPQHVHAASASETGSGQAHANVQPTIIQNIAILAY